MKIFKAEASKSVSFVLYNLRSTFIMLAFLLLLVWLFPGYISMDNYYVIAIVLILLTVSDILNQNRIYQVKIDETSQQIIFSIKNILSGTKEKAVDFKNAGLIVYPKRPNILLLFERPFALYFLKGNKELCSIFGRKDGFSDEGLIEIRKAMEEIPIKVAERKG